MQENAAYNSVPGTLEEAIYEDPDVITRKCVTCDGQQKRKINFSRFEIVAIVALIVATLSLVVDLIQFTVHHSQTNTIKYYNTVWTQKESSPQYIQDLILRQYETKQLVDILQAQLNSSNQVVESIQHEQQLLLNRTAEGLQQQLGEDVAELKAAVSQLQEKLNETIQTLSFKVSSLNQNLSNMPENTPSRSNTCGGPGWRIVAHINMTDPHQSCPQGLHPTDYSIRSCGRPEDSARNCSSVALLTNGSLTPYTEVCGKVTAYRWGLNYAFYGYHSARQTIDGYYVDGLSLTHGSPRVHIWTFATGLFNGTNDQDRYSTLRCPCDPGNAYGSPPFVEDDYFCESVANSSTWILHTTDFFPQRALWTGDGCGQNGSPWFYKKLPSPSSDDIEVRLCTYEDRAHSDIVIEHLEVYVF